MTCDEQGKEQHNQLLRFAPLSLTPEGEKCFFGTSHFRLVANETNWLI